ncbi:MAG: efflux RND transporter periplasmic adaptor subunit [Oceanicoccus sp.]
MNTFVSDLYKSRRSTFKLFVSVSALSASIALYSPAGHGQLIESVLELESQMDCIIEPNKSLELSSQVEGVVAKVFVDRGDRVSAGQTLLELESSIEKAVFNLATERAEFAGRTLSRNDNVAEVMSSQEKDEIITDAKVARLEVQEAAVRLNMKKIVSPIDGLVVEKYRDEGEYVSEEPLFSVINIDPLYVEVIAPVEAFGKTVIGQQALVKPEAPIGGSYNAVITKVDSVIDSISGTFRIRLEIPNPGAKIPSGLKCTVEFPQ